MIIHPYHFCFCEAELPKCYHAYKFLSIPHGRTFVLSVVAVGQNQAPVPSEILHSFVSNNNAELHRLTSNYDAASRSCHDIRFQLFSTEQREVFSIYPAQCKSKSAVSIVIVNFKACPPGFEIAINTCSCEERLKRVIDNNESCNIETGLIKHPGKVWIKPLLNENYSYEGFMWIQNCPKIFCKLQNSSSFIWLNFSSPDVDSQCLHNRTGKMCGSCKEYYSLTLNN